MISAEAFRQHVYPDGINRQIHGLRGLAALLVFIFHVYGIADEWHFWPAHLADLGFCFRLGRHGVEIFFIISGYLITASLLRHRDAGRFLIDRCIRIYPVFLAIHLLVFILGPIVGYRWLAGIDAGHWLLAFLANLLFLPGLFNLPLAQPSAWSLSYEAAFYLISAGLYLMARHGGRTSAVLAGCLVVTPLIALYPKASFFLVGVIVQAIGGARPAQPSGGKGIASLLCLILTLLILTIGETVPYLDGLACLPGFYFFWRIVAGGDLLSRCLRWRWFQYLGTISYSFYLWFGVATYPLKLFIVHFLLGRVDRIWLVLLFAAAGLAASLLAAQISNLLLEVRLGRQLRALVRRRRGAVSLEAAS